MSVTKVVDVDNCREKAAVYSGLATAVLDEAARRVSESSQKQTSPYLSVNPAEVELVPASVPSNPERWIHRHHSAIHPHSPTHSRGRGGHQGPGPGEAVLHSLQCEGWHAQDAGDVRPKTNVSFTPRCPKCPLLITSPTGRSWYCWTYAGQRGPSYSGQRRAEGTWFLNLLMPRSISQYWCRASRTRCQR